MTDQQQTPEPPIKVNIKVDAVEPVVERIARSLESIAASLEAIAPDVEFGASQISGIESILSNHEIQVDVAGRVVTVT